MSSFLTFLISSLIMGAIGNGDLAPAGSPGVPVGDHAPAFILQDQNGVKRSLNDFLKRGKVAIVFHRSIRW
jgi:hypothetical protein